ncbi:MULTISPECIES: patatin-like phospholipase family protein [unclassified Roseateles]|uniref:patatin-like phospholipase family protein n=1 Tax=unclassified Roseateles TaxID=2626991 RepID=UPI0006F79AB9|nr:MULTISPECIES: patatin-like phospholipase family protein [unclassified Roseateles]KQW43270.1 hypothetical protein ASC81_15845 [Pelomonas sp. Root405]KRA71008.1 hypothetical protein ASD88_14370 [Pelomonas sp. Root662]
MKTAVVFQGGGPLGAFGCGAWQVVAPWLRRQGHELVAVAGASIGALNSAVVACHAQDEHDDLGAAALDRLWRRDIAVPLPSVPPMTDEMRAWSGWWTGFALGNPALFAPLYQNWHPLAGLRRVALPLYSQQRMRSMFERIVGDGYVSDASAPVLAVAATDVLSGALRLFSSADAPVDAVQLSASAAIPLMFEPVTIEGRLYCDGEVNRRSPVAPLVNALRDGGRITAEEPLQLVTIGQFCRNAGRAPRTSQELLDRSLQLMLADKLAEPLDVTHHIDITRAPEPHDNISGQFDYSTPRIEALIEAGRIAAQAGLDALRARSLRVVATSAGRA